MNCRNCAAPMRLVRDRDWWVCDHCGTHHFPSPSGDGVRLLGARADHACPACQGPLVLASVDGHRAEHCPRCEGNLLKSGVLAQIVQARRAAWPGPWEAPPPIVPGELQVHRRCPHCLATFETHPYLGGGRVVIDSCYDCGVVWVDRGELARLARTR